MLLQNLIEMHEEVCKRQQKYAEYGLTLQPLLYKVEGATNNSYYLRLDNITWKLPKLPKSIDIAFKTFQDLNLSYPVENNLAWTFIQHFFYDIDTIFDTKSPALFSLLKTLK